MVQGELDNRIGWVRSQTASSMLGAIAEFGIEAV